MPGSNGNGLRPEEEIAQNVGSPAGQGNTKSALGWAGLGLGVVDTVANVLMTERQNRLNREENERNYQRNVDFWQMQNDYNHPAAQMERLREAGLNPNLIYGTPDIAGNNANAPESSKTHYERPNDIDMLGMAMNAQQFAKESDLYDLKIEEQELENEAKRLDNIRRGNENSVFWTKFKQNYRKVESEIGLVDVKKLTELSLQELNDAKTQFQKFVQSAEEQKLPIILENLKKDGKIKDQEYERLKRECDLLEAKKKEVLANAQALYQLAEKYKAEKANIELSTQLMKEMHDAEVALKKSMTELNNANANLADSNAKLAGEKASMYKYEVIADDVNNFLGNVSSFFGLGGLGKLFKSGSSSGTLIQPQGLDYSTPTFFGD